MSWILAIDFGTTSSSVATVDLDGGTARVVEIGGSPRVPSLVVATADGTLLTGTVGAREAAGAAERLERTPKRRVGDRAVLLGEHRYEPSDLVAAVLAHLVDEARQQRGGTEPVEVRLTHPASWAGTRLGAFSAAAERAGLTSVRLLPEPVAAALHYADPEVPVGGLVAVYDLGGGTFDTVVLRRTTDAFELVGPPGGSDRLGGENFDELLYQHLGAVVAAGSPDAWEQLRFSSERPWVRANAALRAEVTAAKEALSTATETTVYVPSPVDREVRVTRDELERLIAADLERTVDELVATVARAGVSLDDLAAVYLAGGSSRIPLVTRLLARRLGEPPTTWGDPKASVVLGAATAPTSSFEAVAPVGVGSDDTIANRRTTVGGALPPHPDDHPADAPGAGSDDLLVDAVVDADDERRDQPQRRLAFLAGAAAALVAVVIAGIVLVGGSGTDLDPMDLTGDQGEGTEEPEDVEEAPFEDLRLVQDAETFGDLSSQRTFRFTDDGDFRSETVLANSGEEELAVAWFEVIPKELAPTADDATYDPAPTEIVEFDPILLWEVDLAPGAELTIVWQPVAMPDDAEPSAEVLEEAARMHEDAVTEAQDRIAERQFELAAAAAAAGEELTLPEVNTPSSDGVTVVGEPSPTTPTTATPTTATPTTATPTTATPTTATPTTATPTTATPTTATPTTQAPVRAPGAPTNVQARNPVEAGTTPGSQETNRVQVTVSWNAPSSTGGQISGYHVRWSVIAPQPCPSGSLGVVHGPVTVTSTGTATSMNVVVDRVNECSSYLRWEVRAFNSAGQSSYTTAGSGRMPNVVGLHTWKGFQLVRAVGGRASGAGTVSPCSSDTSIICTQGVAAGANIAPGAVVGLTTSSSGG